MKGTGCRLSCCERKATLSIENEKDSPLAQSNCIIWQNTVHY
jgi:hypothetical protein